jgi:hypothetical protein
MKKILTYALLIGLSSYSFGQDYFKKIPDAPAKYTAATVTMRMIDGLGYRYYWATMDLRNEDMNFQVSKDARTLRQTMEHLMGLSVMIKSTLTDEAFDRNTNARLMSHEQLRETTLTNLETARKALKNNSKLDKLIIQYGQDATLPFWNAINGPIEDAVWHAGQVVMLRRGAGNPIPKGVNVLLGETQ